MYIFYYPTKDATIYSGSTPEKLESTKVTELNTGLDEILEVDKWIPDTGLNPLVDVNSISRALLYFDYTELSASIMDGTITNPTYSLKLHSTDTTEEIPLSYELYAIPLSSSWQMGVGKKDLVPIERDGVTWNWRDVSGSGGTAWDNPGGDFISTKNISGIVNFVATQSFEYEKNDIDINISTAVEQQISGNIDNHGFIIKHSNVDEQSDVKYGSKKFFSRDTHTIYIPKLAVAWDDSIWDSASATSVGISSLDISDGDFNVYMRGVNAEYKQDSVERFNVYGRRRIISSSFSTTSNYLNVEYLPSSSYYSIKDYKTNEDVIPFDSNTKLSLDGNGNYFNFRMSTLQKERMYKILYKVVSGSNVYIFDDNQFSFKVVK